MGDELAYGCRDAVTLVAHDDDAMVCKLLAVDVVAVEQCAIDGEVGWQTLEQWLERLVGQSDTSDAAHGGLYHLRTICIGGIGRADDLSDAKPVGNTYDGTEVARVLYAIEHQGQVVLWDDNVLLCWYTEYADDTLRVLQEARLSEVVIGGEVVVGKRVVRSQGAGVRSQGAGVSCQGWHRCLLGQNQP